MTLHCTAMLHGGLEDSSDSEGEEKEDTTKTTLQFDDWLSFKLDNEVSSRCKNYMHPLLLSIDRHYTLLHKHVSLFS